MANPEQLPQSGERLEVISDIAGERQAELAKNREHGAEQSPERQAEAADNALREAREVSVSVERPAHEAGHNAADAHRVHSTVTRAGRKKAYRDIMTHTQNELTPASRAFSKVIHQPVVEKTSNAVGATIARPNAILFGALFALFISGGIYLVARYYGYALSGFEAIGAFILGWALGILVDLLRIALRKR